MIQEGSLYDDSQTVKKYITAVKAADAINAIEGGLVSAYARRYSQVRPRGRIMHDLHLSREIRLIMPSATNCV